MSAAGEWQPPVRVAPRVHTGELISTVAALALLPIAFLIRWYGVVGVARLERSGTTTAIGAWDALHVIRWLLLVTIVTALGATALHASQRRHGARTATGLPLLAVSAPTAALVAYRVLVSPPEPVSVVDTKLGAYLGVLAAIGVAIGALESRREERERGRLRARAPRGRRGLARGPVAE